MTLIIYGFTVVLGGIIYLAWHVARNFSMRILQRGKYTFLWFYLCIETGFIMRLLYCISFKFIHFPTAIYGIWCYFPPVFTTTASLFFLISMLNSLDEVYQTSNLLKFGKLRVLVVIYMATFWVICVASYISFAYYDINTDTNSSHQFWNKLYFYTTAGSNMIACVLLITTTIIYVRELKKFTYTYNEKKFVVYAMLAGTILQLTLRVLQAVLNASEVLLNWEKNADANGAIGYQVYLCTYFFLSDVVPTLGYMLFLKKEVQAQATVETASTETASAHSAPSTNITGLLEKFYKKREQHKGKGGSMVRAEYENIQDN